MEPLEHLIRSAGGVLEAEEVIVSRLRSSAHRGRAFQAAAAAFLDHPTSPRGEGVTAATDRNPASNGMHSAAIVSIVSGRAGPAAERRHPDSESGGPH